MGSGGSAVDAMVIGCLGVERRAERFLPCDDLVSATLIENLLEVDGLDGLLEKSPFFQGGLGSLKKID